MNKAYKISKSIFAFLLSAVLLIGMASWITPPASAAISYPGDTSGTYLVGIYLNSNAATELVTGVYDSGMQVVTKNGTTFDPVEYTGVGIRPGFQVKFGQNVCNNANQIANNKSKISIVNASTGIAVTSAGNLTSGSGSTNNSYFISLTSDLQPATSYNIIVQSGIQNGAGNAANTYTYKALFTTQSVKTGAPAITDTVYQYSTSVSGTAPAGAQVTLSLNGTAQPAVMADVGGYWTVDGLTLTTGDQISVTAQLPVSGYTVSDAAAATVLPGADETPPVWSSGILTASSVTSGALTLSWSNLPSDNAAVTGYDIITTVGGIPSTQDVGNVTTYHVAGLTGGSPYTFEVEAYDAAGNVSTTGPQINVTTPNIKEAALSMTLGTPLTFDGGIVVNPITLNTPDAGEANTVTVRDAAADLSSLRLVEGSGLLKSADANGGSGAYGFTLVGAGDAANNDVKITIPYSTGLNGVNIAIYQLGPVDFGQYGGIQYKWQYLPTTVDAANHTATVEISGFGAGGKHIILGILDYSATMACPANYRIENAGRTDTSIDFHIKIGSMIPLKDMTIVRTNAADSSDTATFKVAMNDPAISNFTAQDDSGFFDLFWTDTMPSAGVYYTYTINNATDVLGHTDSAYSSTVRATIDSMANVLNVIEDSFNGVTTDPMCALIDFQTLKFATGDSASSVTQDFFAPVASLVPYGADYKWTSDNTDVLNFDAKSNSFIFKQPSDLKGQTEVTINLTCTITCQVLNWRWNALPTVQDTANGSITKQVIIKFDTTPPTWQTATIPVTAITDTTVTFDIPKAQDTVGVAEVKLLRDGMVCFDLTFDQDFGAGATDYDYYYPRYEVFTVQALGLGNTNTYLLMAKDYQGNWSTANPTVTVTTTGSPHIMSVLNPTTTGFTLSMSPAYPGLTAADFNNYLRTGNVLSYGAMVPITSVTTSDGGATYHFSAALQAGQAYHLLNEILGAGAYTQCVAFTAQVAPSEIAGIEITTKGDISLTFSPDTTDFRTPSTSFAQTQLDFAVTVNGKTVSVESAVSTSTPNKIKLVLPTASKVSGTPNVSVTYTYNASHPIVASDGNSILSFAYNTASPVITNNLTDQTTTVGTQVSLNAASTVADSGTISYQWYSNTSGSTTGGTALGITTAAYSPDVSSAGTFYYYCVVTNTNNAVSGSMTATTISAAAKVTVNADGGSTPAATYTVTYNGNGGSGSPPVDAHTYKSDETAVVLGAGSLTNAGHMFKGWNTMADLSGTTYTQGNSITVKGNITLYAKWSGEQALTVDSVKFGTTPLNGAVIGTAKPEIQISCSRGMADNVNNGNDNNYIKLFSGSTLMPVNIITRANGLGSEDPENGNVYVKPLDNLTSGSYTLQILGGFKANNDKTLDTDLNKVCFTYTFTVSLSSGGGGGDTGVLSGVAKTEITVAGTTTGGVTTATAGADAMDTLISGAKAAEEDGDSALVSIAVNGDSTTKSAHLTIPGSSFAGLAGGTGASLTVSTGVGSVTFPAAAVDSISTAAGGSDVTIKIDAVSTASLSADAQKTVGDRPVYDFSVTAGGAAVSSFGGSAVTVSIPYTPKAGEDLSSILIYYIAADGTLTPVPNCVYDAATGSVTFTTTHFSRYAIGYNKVAFPDVSGWYADAVSFLSARGILSGTGNGTFNPDGTITRAAFVTILANMSGADLSVYKVSAFNDIKTTAWYFRAVQWASTNGIVQGSDGKFSPNDSITRQDVAVILSRYAAKFNLTLPAAAAAKNFPDSAAIASYASSAVTAMQKAGVISGYGNGNFGPLDNATRAEAAKMVAVFLKGILG